MNYQESYHQYLNLLKKDFIKAQKQKPEQLKQKREEHFSLFLKKGFPSPQDPNWCFSSLPFIFKNLTSTDSKESSYKSSASFFLSDFSFFTNSYKVVFHNGQLIKSASYLPPEELAQIRSWKEITPDFPVWTWIKEEISRTQNKDSFHHLTEAFPLDSYILFIPEGSSFSKPLHIHFSFDDVDEKTKTSSLFNLRNFIFLSKKAKINLIETHSLKTKVLLNNVTTIKTAPSSTLNWLSIEQNLPHAFSFNQTHCSMEKASYINKLSCNLGSGISRQRVQINFMEEKAKSLLLSLNLLKENAIRDQKYHHSHTKKQGYSRQFSRGLINDRAKSIFHGNIKVSPSAVNTDCLQSVKNLLLSSQATAYSQPELEIHCGEVKAQHGSTTGALNPEEVFYLRARGLNKKTALEFLMMSYIKEVLSLFPNTDIINKLEEDIKKNKSSYLNLK